MLIHEFVWPEERIDHIARHGVLPRDCAAHDEQRETSLHAVEKMKSKTRLPTTDSIRDLANFWDTHDLTDFDDQLEVVAEPVFERKRELGICDTSLIGRAKELEVAGMLIRNGIYVFWPLVDTGADLLATNRDASRSIPVQVKYRASGWGALDLTVSDKQRFKKPNTVIAFLVGEHAWFLPFDEWSKKHIDKKRRDHRIYVRIRENAKWLAQFKGDGGVRRAFRELLPSAA